MNRIVQLLSAAAILLALTVAAPAQGKKASPFASLSKGHPTARKIVEGLIDDFDSFFDSLDKAMGARTGSEEKTVSAWSSAISQHRSAYTVGMNKAYDIMKKAKSTDGLPGVAPTDWMQWSKHHADLFNELASGTGQQAIQDYRELCKCWVQLKEQLKALPETKEGYRKDIQKVSDDIKDIMEALEKADSAEKVKAQRRRFIRIWTTVNNIQYAHEKFQKNCKDWFGEDEHKPAHFNDKFAKFKKWCEQQQKDPLLEPRCIKSLKSWTSEWSSITMANEMGYKHVLEMVTPIIKGELFSDIGIFQGVKFENLKATIEKYEKTLIAKEDQFGAR
ncbi:MAG: hypothetical protein BWX88_01415 [Planctomycetes bacterium ADurb.Bin126]|nr:MAG: hypothetical protein BWX88_01415 [Planctomycetes bacterium ADurb.Bin126]HOD80541.1 hypothetical protein [Phycisphaerae bacterium]HQL72382.1 hypothetical protein [Phycisphaerae bacterium]